MVFHFGRASCLRACFMSTGRLCSEGNTASLRWPWGGRGASAWRGHRLEHSHHVKSLEAKPLACNLPAPPPAALLSCSTTAASSLSSIVLPRSTSSPDPRLCHIPLERPELGKHSGRENETLQDMILPVSKCGMWRVSYLCGSGIGHLVSDVMRPGQQLCS